MADRSFPDQNLTKSLIAVSNVDGQTPVSLWADPNTHALVISGGGSGGGTQYTDGTAAATHPTGTQEVFTNGSGVVTAVSTANPLPVSASVTPAPNVISTVNSSTTLLAANGVFTGTSEDISAYADVRVSVFSDVASATDGLSMQQSSNGTNWDNVDNYTIPAGTGKAFDVPSYARYFRIVYTNGAALQTAFRLQSVYHIQRTKPSSQRPSDARGNDNDMEENLAYGMVYNSATNAWDRLKNDGNTGTTAVGGSIASGATDSGNPVKIGGVYNSTLSTVTTGQRVNSALNAQGMQYVLQRADSSNLTQVSSSTTSVTILAANTARKGATFFNNSTAILYVAFSSTASTTAFTVPLAASAFFEMPSGYTGIVTGIWASVNGNVIVTEIT